MNLATANRGRLQRLTACALVFALVVQSIAFTLMGARLAVDAAAASDLGGFELCRHDPGGGAGAPESPATDSHCIFCLAGATYVFDTPAVAPQARAVAMAIAQPPFAVWRLPAATVDASARPRGPPLSV